MISAALLLHYKYSSACSKIRIIIHHDHFSLLLKLKSNKISLSPSSESTRNSIITWVILLNIYTIYVYVYMYIFIPCLKATASQRPEKQLHILRYPTGSIPPRFPAITCERLSKWRQNSVRTLSKWRQSCQLRLISARQSLKRQYKQRF